MAEERTLGLARAPQQSNEDLSKEELQRRMDVARDSISNTVSEIKETVANQVQVVKDFMSRRTPIGQRKWVRQQWLARFGCIAEPDWHAREKGDQRCLKGVLKQDR